VVLIKISKKFLIGLSFLLILSSFLVFSIDVKGANTLDFTFEKDVLYSETNPTYDANFNVRNQTVYTGHYPATYSFDGEVGLMGINISWIDEIDVYGNIEVLDNYNGHNTVAKLISKGHYIYHYFNHSISVGSYEFWFLVNSIGLDVYTYFYVMDSLNNLGIRMYTIDDDLVYKDSAGTSITIKSNFIEVDTWYHLKVDFYTALDEFDVYVNGVLELEHCNMSNSVDDLYYFKFAKYHSSNYTNVIFDAVGYSWDETSYTGDWFDLSEEDNSPTGITWDGDSFWVVGYDTKKVYRYDSIGTYTGVYFNVGVQDSFP